MVQFSGASPVLVGVWALYPFLNIKTLKRNNRLKRETQQIEVYVFLELPFGSKKYGISAFFALIKALEAFFKGFLMPKIF